MVAFFSQVPFDLAVKEVLEQLKKVAKGELRTPDTEKRRFGNIFCAAVTLPVVDIKLILGKDQWVHSIVGWQCSRRLDYKLASKDPQTKKFVQGSHLEHTLQKTHITLAHKRSHGVTAVASYGVYHQQKVPVEFTALFFSDKMAALEARLGSVNREMIASRNQWPHTTLWAAPGTAPRVANALPQLHSEGKAKRVDMDPPIAVRGVLDFY